MKIIDNFLDEESFSKLKDSIFSEQFPWYWCDNTVDKKDDNRCDLLDNYQLYHNFFHYNIPCSDYMEIIYPVMDALKIEPWNCIKVKANLNPRTSKIVEHGFHVDVLLKVKTAVLYFNDNDGYTLFEDGTKVESVENRILIFDSDIRHSGSSCTNQSKRVVLNLNYYPEPLDIFQ